MFQVKKEGGEKEDSWFDGLLGRISWLWSSEETTVADEPESRSECLKFAVQCNA